MTNRLSAFLWLGLLPATLAAAGTATVFATEVEDVEGIADLRGSDAPADGRKRAREAELEAIRRTIEVSERRQASLREEIAGLDTDRASLSADLIATAQRMRDAETDIQSLESRLEQLRGDEDGVRGSLRERRAVMAEVLMALQRMGNTPPPAILSRPEDALAAIRGSILAGSVLPDIRVEAEALAADLSELTQVTDQIRANHAELRTRYASLGEEQARIDLLVASKQAQREQTASALSSEQSKAGDLAGRAETLQSLIKTLEAEVASASRAAQEASEAARTAQPATPDDAVRRLADTSRIAPAVRFADAKGLLTLPVSGTRTLGFGEADEIGGKAQGLSFATRAGTPVLAPSDAWVVYAGPFRSYGQVLILNAGDGYHIVLAGMERIDVALGQFVLAGEPVALMGATRLASLGDVDHTSAQPVLYVEFRKDGTAIDSAPWWAQAKDGEVNG